MAAISMSAHPEVFDEVAYLYDGTVEGLFCCIFDAFAKDEEPSDICRHDSFQPRFLERSHEVVTDQRIAKRVQKSLLANVGHEAYYAILRCSLSSDPSAPRAVLDFVKYAYKKSDWKCFSCKSKSGCSCAMKKSICPKFAKSAFSAITNPSVGNLFKISRSVANECEKVRQFTRFQHLVSDTFDFWFAQVSPKDSVIPLIMNYFVERFSVSSFMILDDVHDIAGIFNGSDWYLMDVSDADIEGLVKYKGFEEKSMQDAWRKFYHSVTIKERYNPELRIQHMPSRFWKHLTELQIQEDIRK